MRTVHGVDAQRMRRSAILPQRPARVGLVVLGMASAAFVLGVAGVMLCIAGDYALILTAVLALAISALLAGAAWLLQARRLPARRSDDSSQLASTHGAR